MITSCRRQYGVRSTEYLDTYTKLCGPELFLFVSSGAIPVGLFGLRDWPSPATVVQHRTMSEVPSLYMHGDRFGYQSG